MLLPIYAYGQPVLKKVADDITPQYPNLEKLIADMWDTMYDAHGVGLAAPQIGHSIRLFVIDTIQLEKEDNPDFKGFKRVFINAQKVEESGSKWSYEEGCLSVPNIRAEVNRPPKMSIRFLNERFEEETLHLDGVNARVVQHEYDHIEGVLFTDHMSPVKRTLIRHKLEKIRIGKIKTEYKMKFAASK
jgi:peptide deformylase